MINDLGSAVPIVFKCCLILTCMKPDIFSDWLPALQKLRLLAILCKCTVNSDERICQFHAKFLDLKGNGDKKHHFLI